MTRYLRSAAASLAVLFLVVTSASAAPILQVSGGILTGATGVDVNGTLYDVEFLDGTCVSLFTGCDQASDLAFQTQADATIAGLALLDQVFVDGPLGNFDTNPALTRGCSGIICFAEIPYLFSGSSVLTRSARNAGIEASDTLFISLFDGNLDLTIFSGSTYARFTPAAPTVPEPASLSLLGLGLAGLGTRRWRQGRAS